MKIENIFRKIPMFENLKMDTVLFEGKYPVLFTCTINRDIYLFICCMVNAQLVKWIGTKTNYATLIQLLKNEITIRDAFLGVTDEKIIINYDGKEAVADTVKKNRISVELLPTEGEYMDAEDGEYSKEIATFEERAHTVEFKMPVRKQKMYHYSYENAFFVILDNNPLVFNRSYGINIDIKKVTCIANA